MVKSNKNQYYLLFDINTKDPNFYSNFYSNIKEFFNISSCISKVDVNIYQKEMSMSFIKSIKKIIYNNSSKQKTKSHSLVDDNEMEM